MSSKKTYEEILKEIENQGVELLWKKEEFNENYEGVNKTKLPIICICGEKDFKHFSKIKKGQKCKKCSITRQKKKYEEVLKEIENQGMEFLWTEEEFKKEYIDAKQTKLLLLCSCKRECEMNFSNIKQGFKCIGCSYERMKKTNLNNTGFEYPLQSTEVKEKTKQTCLKRLGVTNPMQNAIISEKNQKNSFKCKDYILPSGKIIQIQGYEHLALDELLYEEDINENDIITSRTKVPEIWYTYEDGIKHRYYIDIYIKSLNKCIEVKSNWIYDIHLEKNKLKQKAVIKAGYEYELRFYDNKGRIYNL